MLNKKPSLTGRQKAAIFLVAVGNEVAADIFKHLREDEIEQITFEIARLDKITPEDKEKVLVEFNELMMAQEFITNGGIDFARGLLEKALGNQKAIDIIKDQREADNDNQKKRDIHHVHRPSGNQIPASAGMTMAL